MTSRIPETERPLKTVRDSWSSIAEQIQRNLETAQPLTIRGRVVEVRGTIVTAEIPSARIGELCLLRSPDGSWEIPAEIVAFNREAALLTPLGRLEGLSADAEIIPTGHVHKVVVGNSLIGRILDGMGNPIDGGPPLRQSPEDVEYPVYSEPPNPLERKLISRPLATGIRGIDGLLTCGEGQRLGVFAAAGAGKSTLMASIVRATEADVVVVALIGERGREVREFLDHSLGEAGLRRSVIVVSTSDRPAMERLKAAHVATAIAEYFRDQGKRVLLLMDSITRFARALREIGLAAGEPPARRGFPPSVFSQLPLLVERAGPGAKGSITAFYTVLVEGDDMTEPVADETRSLLDGHIVLSRKLASANHYPAIDVLDSISRVMQNIVSKEHGQAASEFRDLLSRYRDLELMIQLGEYKKGGDPLADKAVERIGGFNRFLRQTTTESSLFETTLRQLKEAVA